jgi:hypothetical protein
VHGCRELARLPARDGKRLPAGGSEVFRQEDDLADVIGGVRDPRLMAWTAVWGSDRM